MHIINAQIFIANALISTPSIFAQIIPSNSKILIVTDEVVAPLHLQQLLQTLSTWQIQVLTLQSGEHNKSWAAVETILNTLVHEYDRSSTIIALGGGIVGDLAGFAAAIFMRGINLVQIPTTLLAQVDASVGGKNGCNFQGVKNLIGTFYQPKAVLIDPMLLTSLPEREFKAGLAEVIKYGFACDAEFFAWLEANKPSIEARVPEVISFMIARCCAIKHSIVELDPQDLQQRMILNFGHTFGHAIEAATRFNTYLHGEAVALGMLLATRLAVKLGLLSQHIDARLVSLIEYFGLPVQLDLSICRPDKLFNYIMHDKKRHVGKLTLILPCALGKAKVMPDLEFADMEDFISLCLRDSMVVIGDNV